MELKSRQVLLLQLITLAAYAMLYIFPIAAFPTSFSKSVYAFHLPSEHKLITYSEYSAYVWITAALLPFMAVTLATARHFYNVFFLLLTSFLVFLVVYPQSFSFGTDAVPAAFDTRPNWSVYMAVYAPPTASLGLKLLQFKRLAHRKK